MGKQNVIKNTILKLHNKKNILLNTYCGSTINNSKKKHFHLFISLKISLQKLSNKFSKSHPDEI